MSTRFVLRTLCVALALAAAGLSAAPLGSGIDRTGMDPAARPQDSLFDAVNGGWLKATEIPADKSAYGAMVQIRDQVDERLKGLVDGLLAQPQPAGSNGRKIADFYRAYLDTAAIDAAGTAPLAPSMAQIGAVADVAGLVRLLGRNQARGGGPLRVDIGADAKRPDLTVAGYEQSGLGLPDRDYYLKDDDRYAKARAAYLGYLQALFTLTGDAEASAHAAAVLALEKRLAEAQWTRVDNRDPVKIYNPMPPDELARRAPGIDWAQFAAGAELPAGATIVVRQPSYVAALAQLLRSEPLDHWKLYLKAHRLDEAAPVLPAAFRDARFAFRGTALQGLVQERPRWQQALGELNFALGEAVGERYVAQYFPPAAKARMLAMVDNLMKAFASSIVGLHWMSKATQAAAHDKLAKYMTKIGYPDAWRDYGPLEIVAGEALANRDRSVAFNYRRDAVRVGGPIDRREWGMTPQTVNAYYNPSQNEIVFPAAILQPPFFDMAADDAANYGGIGAVIGHEISHGFDDEGGQYDGDGRLRNWWTDGDRKAFEAITAKLVAQYAAYEPIPGKTLNGQLTLGENIADLSGLQIAFKAYRLSLAGKPSPVIDGLTGEQRFFFGWAQAWRVKMRDARALQLLTMDPHSPGRFRADGAAVNHDGFHEAFGTKPGDGMYKSPDERIRLW